MIKKIIFIALLCFLFTPNAYATLDVFTSSSGEKYYRYTANGHTVKVTRVSSIKAYNSSALTVRGAATVVMTSPAGKAVTKAVPYLANKPFLKFGIASLVVGGLIYAGDELFEYLESQGGANQSGNLTFPIEPDCSMATFMPEYDAWRSDGTHKTSSSLASEWINGNWDNSCLSPWPNKTGIKTSSHCGVPLHYYTCWCPANTCQAGTEPLYFVRYVTWSSFATIGETLSGGVFTPTDPADLDQILEDYADTNSEDFVHAGGDAIDNITDGLSDTTSPLRDNPNIDYDGLAKAFAEALDDTMMQSLIDALADPEDYPDLDVVDVEDVEPQEGMTPAEMQNAVKVGVLRALEQRNEIAKAETLTPLNPLPITETPEEYGVIKPIIDVFMDGIKSLPVISLFTDIKDITASGSCTFNLIVHNPITKVDETVDLTFCPYEDIFRGIGSFLLIFVTIIWIRYLFEG